MDLAPSPHAGSSITSVVVKAVVTNITNGSTNTVLLARRSRGVARLRPSVYGAFSTLVSTPAAPFVPFAGISLAERRSPFMAIVIRDIVGVDKTVVMARTAIMAPVAGAIKVITCGRVDIITLDALVLA